MKIKLFIWCHNFLFSEGIMQLLADEKDFSVSCLTDVTDMQGKKGDIILCDFDIFFEHPEVFMNEKMKVLLIRNTPKYPAISGKVAEMINRGVVGIISADTDSSLLKKAIRAVYRGELWLTHESMKDILCRVNYEKPNLTRQEEMVAKCICNGLRNKEIAQKLDISEQTVKSHCNRIYKKFGVSDRLQLALLMTR